MLIRKRYAVDEIFSNKVISLESVEHIKDSSSSGVLARFNSAIYMVSKKQLNFTSNIEKDYNPNKMNQITTVSYLH